MCSRLKERRNVINRATLHEAESKLAFFTVPSNVEIYGLSVKSTVSILEELDIFSYW